MKAVFLPFFFFYSGMRLRLNKKGGLIFAERGFFAIFIYCMVPANGLNAHYSATAALSACTDYGHMISDN